MEFLEVLYKMELWDFLIDKVCIIIWNNILFLRISFLILLLLITFIYKKRKLLKKVLFPLNYDTLCLEIGYMLNKNKNLWREFGPNSSSNSDKDPLKQDLKLWEVIKSNTILPNNKKINDLIEQNKKIIPPSDKFIFEKMRQHIIAFEAHVFDETIDYRNNQFPIEFEKLIYSKCEALNAKHIQKISKWLKKNLFDKNYKNLKIESIWLFGSILKEEYESINDIDVLIFSDITSQQQIAELADLVKNIEFEFAKFFKKDLNFISFTKREERGLHDFIEQIDIKRKL